MTLPVIILKSNIMNFSLGEISTAVLTLILRETKGYT